MELDISGNMPITIIVYYKCMYLESFTIFCSEEFRRTQNFQKILISFNKAESYTEQ